MLTHNLTVAMSGCLKLYKLDAFGQTWTQDQVVLSAYRSITDPRVIQGQYDKQDLWVLSTYLYLYFGHVSTHLFVSMFPNKGGLLGQIWTHFLKPS